MSLAKALVLLWKQTKLNPGITGSYLQVIFHWSDPHPVGHTVCFTVQFYQRNGQPYPICDTDHLVVDVSEGSRKVGNCKGIFQKNVSI